MQVWRKLVGLFLLAARWLVAGIFLRSGLAKATRLAAFHSAVRNYRLLPPALVAVVATVLPFAEITAGILLAIGVLPVLVAATLALLLVIFATAIAINLARGRIFECGCSASAVAPSTISWRHVVVDLLLAAVAAVIAVAPPAAAQLWRGPAGLVQVTTQGGGAFPVLLAVLVCFAVIPLMQRAAAVRGLAAAASRQLDAGAIHSEPRRN
jgi:uncharacterized membrane protein YphA (DoxX/SURF4 family)